MSEHLLQHIIGQLEKIESRVDNLEKNMATKQDLQKIDEKLELIHNQVVHNTEQIVDLNALATKVKEHDTDIKILKKVLAN